MGRGRRSHSSSGRSSKSYSRSRSPSVEKEGTRVHVGDLSSRVVKEDLEEAFKAFGPLREVWMANSPPCFAFIVFKRPRDAEESVREMNGVTLNGSRIRVTLALPRARQRRAARPFNADMRCYQCGERGHFSRECIGIGRNRNLMSPRFRGRSPSPRRRRRSYSRSRSPSNSRSRSRSRGGRRSGRHDERREERRGGSRDRQGGSGEHSAARRRDSRERESSRDRRGGSDKRSSGADKRRESRDGPTEAEILAANDV